MFSILSKQVDMLMNNVIELCYFMRGSITYEEMMLRTPGERQRIADFVSARLKGEAKKDFPVY